MSNAIVTVDWIHRRVTKRDDASALTVFTWDDEEASNWRRCCRSGASCMIMWMRHCESEANVANREDWDTSYFRQPDCTATGFYQSLAMGDSLKRYRIANVYSSFLPRAFETAAMAAEALGVADLPVTRLDHIGEGDRWFDKVGRVQRPEAGTENSLMLSESNAKARALNKLLGREAVAPDDSPDRRLMASTPFADDYFEFLRCVLQDWLSASHEPPAIKLVVSHGRYIRDNVLGNLPAHLHPRNTQCFLLRYSKDQGGPWIVDVVATVVPR